MSIAAILSRPYPAPQSIRERIFLCIGIGAFIAFFLLAFRPFGLANVPAIKIFGYGLITSFALALSFFVFPAIFRRHFREEVWTAGKEIFWSLVTIVLIGAGNFLYTTWLGYFRFNLLTFFYFQLITVVVGIFPLTLMILLRQNRSMKKYIREAEEISKNLHYEEKISSDNSYEISPEKISLKTDEGKILLEFERENFLFASAADNYVEIFLLRGEKITSQLVRMTMAKLAEQISGEKKFYRCHRSYIANLDKVSGVHGNSQGLRLVLDGYEKEIPVARAKSQEIRDLLC